MAVEYRKAGLRTFYRISGNEVVKVFNREKLSEIQVSDNWLIAADAIDFDTTAITESEFTEQFNLAMSRIKNFKV